MANMIGTLKQPAARVVERVQPVSSVRFDWAAALLSGALVGGAYLDGWAHEHGKVDQSFFTPWHGILYSAMLVIGIFLAIPFATNLLRGFNWRRALPIGYGLSMIGVLVFALGGVGDMLWHILFGIENNVEALLSPTHLLLAVGWVLIVSGPLRAAWNRSDAAARTPAATILPALLALTWMLSVFIFFTAYANPFGETMAAIAGRSVQTDVEQALSIVGFLVQPALLMGLVLLALRRWTLPFGSLTLLLTLTTTLVAVLHDQYGLIVVAVLAGLLSDLVLRWLQPTAERPLALRIFAFAVPAILYTLYFGALALTDGIAWTIHLWAGAIVLAGVVGLLLSYVAVPPAAPAIEPAAETR